ncbi:MAG TPA: hypothetical protein VLA51_07790, partial [Paracoccaceae bacterium]|nr:hypothetical protein [Paracoccaceae bacterium]
GGDVNHVLSEFGLLGGGAEMINPVMTMAGLDSGAAAFGIESNLGGSAKVAIHAHSNINNPYRSASGAGVAFTLGDEKESLSIGYSTMHEDGAALGMISMNASAPLVADSRALDLGYSLQVANGLRFNANAQFGTLDSSASGMWGAQDGTLFNAFGVNLEAGGVFTGADRLVLSVAQPLAITDGSMSLHMPVARDAGGNVAYSNSVLDLAPLERQMDISLEYGIPLWSQTDLRLGAAYSLNAGHIQGSEAASLAAGLEIRW